jgi:hypothetical protein
MEKKDIITQPFIGTGLTLNITGEEISSLLDTNELYPAARAKFWKIKDHCLQSLWITKDNPSMYTSYKNVMDHYLGNSANYIMRDHMERCDDQEIQEFKHNYYRFIVVISHIDTLSEEQKRSFLQQLKLLHDDNTLPTENPITTMDRILSSL